MSILDTKDLKKQNKFYIIFTIFIMFFSTIYEIFSHGVISNYMVFAFICPLLSLIINITLISKKIEIPKLSKNTFDAFIITITLYCIMKGFLEIYGTENPLIMAYIILGITLLIISITTFIINKNKVNVLK